MVRHAQERSTATAEYVCPPRPVGRVQTGWCTDEQVRPPVPVHITCAGHSGPERIAGLLPGEVQQKPPRSARVDVCIAGPVARCTGDDVVDLVPIDIEGVGHRVPELVAGSPGEPVLLLTTPRIPHSGRAGRGPAPSRIADKSPRTTAPARVAEFAHRPAEVGRRRIAQRLQHLDSWFDEPGRRLTGGCPGDQQRHRHRCAHQPSRHASSSVVPVREDARSGDQAGAVTIVLIQSDGVDPNASRKLRVRWLWWANPRPTASPARSPRKSSS